MRQALALAAAALFMASGCAMQDDSFAQRSETVNLTGTVESVDLENRLFRVRDGRTAVTFRAGPQVRNLAQLEPGDRITMEYFESVAVGLADPADPGTAVGELVVGRAAPGERPGGGAAGSFSGVVEFVGYDPATNVASIRLGDGTLEQVVVAPEMRAFAAARAPGDRIVVAIDRAIAVFVEEIG